MTTENAATGCPDVETLAAFKDGRMDSAARAHVELHLTTCQDCFDVLIDTTLALQDLAGNGGADLMTRRRQVLGMRPRTYAVVVGLAALILVAVSEPYFAIRYAANQGMKDLALASTSIRFSEARLDHEFVWSPLPLRPRGNGSSTPPAAVAAIAQRLEALPARNANSATLHAAGLAWLATGHLDEAVSILSNASTASPSDLEIAIDLSAALLERSSRNQNKSDAEAALAVLDGANRGRANPAVLFNRALALEMSGQPSAVQAWRDYLKADSVTNWAGEAKGHLTSLVSRIPGGSR